MHLEKLRIQTESGAGSVEHDFSAPPESIRRWTFLRQGDNENVIPLAALACTGHRHSAALMEMLRSHAAIRAGGTRVEFALVRRPPQECSESHNSRLFGGWVVERDGRIEHLRARTHRPSDSGTPMRRPPSGAGNGNWLLLGYGRHVRRQPLCDRFDFLDPHHRLRRFGGLFNAQMPLTNPLAFLRRLHSKGVLYEKERSLSFITRLNAALCDLLEIEPAAWLAKRYDFAGFWSSAPSERRVVATILLDAARHVLDSAVQVRDPFEQSGIVLLEDLSVRPEWFRKMVLVFEGLFPQLQFILSVSKALQDALPRRLRHQSLHVPEAKPRLKGRLRLRLPPSTVLLLDVDSTLPNLALMKLSRHFKEQGKRVVLGRKEAKFTRAEAVFASCVFAFPQSARRVEALRQYYGPDLQVGGSGIDIKKRLPPELENLPPDYSLYPELSDRALGFLTRGCPLHCPFCIVPIKEGKPRQVSDLDSLLQGRKKLILLDDNILSHPAGVELMEEMLRRDLAVNFNQTLDIRFLTPVTAGLLRRIRCSNVRFTRRNYYFSLNNTRGLNLVRERYRLLEVTRRDNVEFVAMYGFDTTLAQDVERFRFLRSLPGAYVFMQVYRPVLGRPEADLSGFFDEDADRHIDALLEVNFTQNMKSMEVYYRWVCLQYARLKGRIHRKLVETLYRYNQRHRMGGFLLKLKKLCREREAIETAGHKADSVNEYLEPVPRWRSVNAGAGFQMHAHRPKPR